MSECATRCHAERVLSVVGNGLCPDNDRPETLIATSWERCINNYGLDPDASHSPVVLEGAALRERQARLGELLEIARAECQNLFEQTAASGYAVLLTDADGVIVNYVCDPLLDATFRHAGLWQGAIWSEEHEGTNGIGTCLTEGVAITVHRDDHFHSCYTTLTGSAAPIHDPQGRMLAVLEESCVNSRDTKQSQFHTMALVNMSAKLIENLNFLRQYRNASVLRFHSRPEFVGLLTEAMLAVDEEGIILAANPGAVDQLGYTGREQLVGHFIGAALDISHATLAERSMYQSHTVWPVRDTRYGRRYYVMLRGPEKTVQRGGQARAQRGLITVPPKKDALNLTLTGLVGGDPHMAYNVRCARRVADKDVPIMLSGETGTGKEAFARAIHEASLRADKTFVALNCAAIPDTLIESELFGYKHGAFTGARREGMRGKVLQSSGGTLFLDEIGDMPAQLQTRLLRVLEEKEVLPLGSEKLITVDLHVICASNQSLKAMVECGEFREDLYYRLNGITLTLPPLRERTDKEALIRGALAAENTTMETVAIEEQAFQQLMRYDWPGNIRELRNVLRTALALADDSIVRLADLPKEIARAGTDNGFAAEPQTLPEQASMPAPAAGIGAVTPLESAEREVLLKELERNHWNVTTTAAKLKMSRSTVYRKVKKHGIPIA